MSTANRGKVAEKLLQKHLQELCTSQKRAYYRFPDMMAGSRQPTLCDYLFLDNGKPYMIECKETQHDYRLPYGNFDAAQVGRMRLLEMAGAQGLVLVYHSGIKLWRGYGLSRFVDRSVGGSWDLRDTAPKTLKELLV